FHIAFLMFFIAIFPVGDWALRPLENRFATATPEHVDGIIIIGSDENPTLTEARGHPILHEAAVDYMTFASLARQYPQARLVYAGGSSLLAPHGMSITNADVAKKALAAYGVPVDRVTFEDKSRTTHENATAAAALVHPQPQEKWLL